MRDVDAKDGKCAGVECENDAGTLKCPTCLKIGKETSFCSQECFKKSWPDHKAAHKSSTTALYNPFPKFSFTGSLRPIYPLSPRRNVPDSIPHPPWSKDGDPKYKSAGRHTITILDKKQQDGMRKVCRLAREVLDIAAQAIKPGITTDYIDEIVHAECIKRNVSLLILPTALHANSIVLSISTELRTFSKVCLHVSKRSHMPWDPRSTNANGGRHTES